MQVPLTSADTSMFSKYHAVGNASLPKAEVICILDVPTDPLVRAENAALINAIWDRHEILVQHLNARERLFAKSHESTCEVTKCTFVQGWDHPGLSKIFKLMHIKYFKSVSVFIPT